MLKSAKAGDIVFLRNGAKAVIESISEHSMYMYVGREYLDNGGQGRYYSWTEHGFFDGSHKSDFDVVGFTQVTSSGLTTTYRQVSSGSAGQDYSINIPNGVSIKTEPKTSAPSLSSLEQFREDTYEEWRKYSPEW
jgi:hypothetical protein